MTLKEYKQELHKAYLMHTHDANIAADRYTLAKTEQERVQAEIKITEHLAASFALRWALDRASLVDGGEE